MNDGTASRGRSLARAGHVIRARQVAADGDAARGQEHRDRPSWQCVTATRRSPGSTSPAPRRATRRPGTWTRSSTCSGRTPTSPSTPGRRSGCRASGRRSSGAAPSASATASGSSTTSRASGPRARGWGGSRHTCGIGRIPLELCPSSNVQTGAATSVAAHPITQLKDLRFRVTVNTDNRLMSGTSMSQEMSLLVQDAGWDVDDLRWVTDQRDEVRVPAVRRAVGDHRGADQTGVSGALTPGAAMGGGVPWRPWTWTPTSRRTTASGSAARAGSARPAERGRSR